MGVCEDTSQGVAEGQPFRQYLFVLAASAVLNNLNRGSPYLIISLLTLCLLIMQEPLATMMRWILLPCSFPTHVCFFGGL